MSFTSHPFRVIELVDIDDDGIYYWSCSSCGCTGKQSKHVIPYKPGSFPDAMPALIIQYHCHIEQGHALTREDVKEWSL